ncbi:hypothetical protein D083_3751 [Dickeya solani RNS 08.23.3.1.A]|nr:hypothetical protein D083_3751 [Dickeya solani RNS 08.23.3.1.A]
MADGASSRTLPLFSPVLLLPTIAGIGLNHAVSRFFTAVFPLQ